MSRSACLFALALLALASPVRGQESARPGTLSPALGGTALGEGAAVAGTGGAAGALAEVAPRRAERRRAILERAVAYAKHPWVARPENVFHGETDEGVRVDTPDAGHRSDGFATDGSVTVGVPYKWGGFSTLEQFDAGIAEGRPAGHLPASGGAAGSDRPVGVDCSGFVARCWDLPFKHSTRSLGRVSYRLGGLDELLPGDCINSYDGHAMIFEGMAEDGRSFVVYEAAFPLVRRSVYAPERLDERYHALRYQPLDARWETVSPAPADATLEPGRFVPGERGEAGPRELAATRGDWVRHGREFVGLDVPVAGVRRLALDRDREGLVTQVALTWGERVEEREERLDPDLEMVDALLAMYGSSQPMVDVELVDLRIEPGAWHHPGGELGARRVTARVEAAFASRGSRHPVVLELEAVLADAVPFLGALEVTLTTRVTWGGQERASTSRSRLEAWHDEP